MMDRMLRGIAMALVLVLAMPAFLEVAAIGNPNQTLAAIALLVLGVMGGLYAAISRRPLAARFTTIVYGVFGVGFALFVSLQPVSFLLAYVVGLLGMNVLLYHIAAFGPVLSYMQDDDLAARRTQEVALRSLGVSCFALGLAYGGSLALLPLFAVDAGSTDPWFALALGAALVLLLTLLVMLPESVIVRRRRGLQSR